MNYGHCIRNDVLPRSHYQQTGYSDEEEEEEENYEIIVQEKYCWGFFVGECFMTFFPPFPNYVIAHQIFTILF